MSGQVEAGSTSWLRAEPRTEVSKSTAEVGAPIFKRRESFGPMLDRQLAGWLESPAGRSILETPVSKRTTPPGSEPRIVVQCARVSEDGTRG